MLEAPQNLPEEAADLRALLASREVEIIGFKAELHSRDLLIEKLKHQLFGLRRHQFGSSSEGLDQLELTLEEEEIARAAETPASIEGDEPVEEKRRPKRKPLPGHLPRNETVLAPGDVIDNGLHVSRNRDAPWTEGTVMDYNRLILAINGY